MTINSPSNAITILCDQCGAAFEMTSFQPQVFCGHCGHKQAVDPAMKAELLEYSDAVQHQLEMTELEQEMSADTRRSAEQMKAGASLKGIFIVIMATVGLPFAAGLAVLIMARSGIIDPTYDVYMGVIVVVGSFLGLIFSFIWYLSGNLKAVSNTGSPDGTTVRCPLCGASNGFTLGEIVETCLYCNALLMPDKGARRQSIDAAKLKVRRAEMETVRADRALNYTVGTVTPGPRVFVLVFGLGLMVVIFIGAFVRSWEMSVGAEPFSPSIYPHWLLGILALAGTLGIAAKLKRMQERVKKSVGGIASFYGGEGLNTKGILNWFNGYWPSPIPSMEMIPAQYHCGGAFVLEGYPTLLEINPKPLTQQHKIWARIHISCIVPESMKQAVPLEGDAEELKAKIHAAGLSYWLTDAGFVFRAQDSIVKGLFDPQNIENLSEHIPMLVKFAAAHNAIPSPRIP